MSELLGAVLSIAIIAAVTFGVLAAFPRSRRSLVPGTIITLLIFLLLNVLGSALVGPFDLRAMFFVTPVVIAFVTCWYFWKIKRREAH
ncbi:MAG TPA: hypothetical protein VMN38_00485 [Sphingomicrobium sp.]|nr:hypothetical protein [Sphingomicrobium sp.]